MPIEPPPELRPVIDQLLSASKALLALAAIHPNDQRFPLAARNVDAAISELSTPSKTRSAT